MDWTVYLSNALVAAALGAGTNELAIITILRYILPRKKGEIARRIRFLISSDLLSPEKIREKLDEPQILSLLRRNIDAALAEWLSRELPAPEALLESRRDEADLFAVKLGGILVDGLCARVDNDAFVHDTMVPFLRERYRVLRQRAPGTFLLNPDAVVAEAAGEWVKGLESSEAVRERVRQSVDQWLAARIDRADTLGQLLPSGVTNALREFAGEQAPAVVEQLAQLLADPAVQDAVAGSVMSAIQEQLRGQGMLGNLKGMFVGAMRVEKDVRGVCRRLPATLRRNLQRPERLGEISRALGRAVADKLDQPLDPEYRTLEKRVWLGNLIVGMVWRSSVFDNLASALRGLVENTLSRSLAETLGGVGVEDLPESVFIEVAERVRRVLCSSGTRSFLAGQFEELYSGWKARPLGRLDRFVDAPVRERLASALAEEIREVLRLRLADFAEESGVWDIVVASIESYDDRQLANLIHQLARNELRWVTVLGGVIGFAVGLAHTFVLDLWRVL